MDVDQALVNFALHQIPPADEVDLAEATDTGAAAIALSYEADLAERWYRALLTREDISPFESFATLIVERDEIGIAVDRRLEEHDFEVVEHLVRLGIPWSHPAIEEALEGEYHHAAFWMLTEVDLDAAEEWLEDCEELDAAVEALRVWGILGVETGLQHAVDLRDILEGDTSRTAKRARQSIDLAAASMAPVTYARALLRGEFDADWVRSRTCMADWIQTTGPNGWLDALAILDAADHSQAFEFAAHFAAAAASARFFEESGELEEICVELLTNPTADWRTLTNRSEFALALALADDEDLQRMLAEAFAHEFLAHRDGSPGIPGLPLSGGALDAEIVEEAAAVFADIEESEFHEDQVVAAVRMFTDLAFWVREEPATVESLVGIAERWSKERFPKAVQAAARYAATLAGVEFDPEESWLPQLQLLSEGGRPDLAHLADLAREEGTDALLALDRLAHAEGGLPYLLELWRSAPVIRVDLVRDAAALALERLGGASSA